MVVRECWWCVVCGVGGWCVDWDCGYGVYNCGVVWFGRGRFCLIFDWFVLGIFVVDGIWWLWVLGFGFGNGWFWCLDLGLDCLVVNGCGGVVGWCCVLVLFDVVLWLFVLLIWLCWMVWVGNCWCCVLGWWYGFVCCLVWIVVLLVLGWFYVIGWVVLGCLVRVVGYLVILDWNCCCGLGLDFCCCYGIGWFGDCGCGSSYLGWCIIWDCFWLLVGVMGRWLWYLFVNNKYYYFINL